jgi:hypothetical protein
LTVPLCPTCRNLMIFGLFCNKGDSVVNAELNRLLLLLRNNTGTTCALKLEIT